ncbi:MAG: hypothetical protein ACQEXV_22420 [Bacillota bacterium]
MQYALMQVNENTKVIIDANEIQALDNYKEGHGLKDFHPDDESLTAKVVYGTFIPQPDENYEDITSEIERSKGFAFGYIHNDQCHLLMLSDIILYEPLKNNYIPFAALIHTDLELNCTKELAISAFLRYQNMIPEDNILNRTGILSIQEEEKQVLKVTKDNWTIFIRQERLPGEVEKCHHSVKKSKKVIEKLKQAESLKDGKHYAYVLSHTYDQDPTRLFYFRAPYSEEVMNALIAFIQYQCSAIEITYSMDQTEIVEILTTLYDCTESKEPILNATKIDLYVNWERWVHPDLRTVSLFMRDELNSMLHNFLLEDVKKVLQ